ncbi:MAG: thioredoxin family protein [Candidatus Anstonellaceae archaeon]
MKIEILGMGCQKCKELKENVLYALRVLNKKAEIQEIKDIEEIVNRGITRTPALIVNGNIVLEGQIADKSKLIEILKNY